MSEKMLPNDLTADGVINRWWHFILPSSVRDEFKRHIELAVSARPLSAAQAAELKRLAKKWADAEYWLAFSVGADDARRTELRRQRDAAQSLFDAKLKELSE